MTTTTWRDLGPQDADLLHWMDETVSQPAPALGRPGPLCPFVPRARKRQTIRVCEVSPATPATVLEIAEDFAAMAPRSAADADWPVKCALVLLPGSSTPAGLVDLVAAVKARLLESGLTCGNFHPEAEDRSARAENLLVARAPRPLLALRNLHAHDRLFLGDHPDYRELFERWERTHG